MTKTQQLTASEQAVQKQVEFLRSWMPTKDLSAAEWACVFGRLALEMSETVREETER